MRQVSSRIGAEYAERSPERVTQRKGWSRAWDTRVGTMKLHIPKLRGELLPSLLPTASHRASAGCDPAGLRGSPLSTRRVDDLAKALGCGGYLQEPGVRICQELDVVVDGFGPSAGRWTLPLPGCSWTHCPRRSADGRQDRQRQRGGGDGGQWRPASGRSSGWTCVPAEDGAFWLAFLRSCPPGASVGWSWWYRTLDQGLRGAIVRSLRRSQLATVPHPVHDQPAHSGPQARPGPMGGHHGPHHLPATTPPPRGTRPTRRVTSQLHRSVPRGRLSTGRSGTRRPGLLQLPLAHWKKLGVRQPTWSVTTRRSGDAPIVVASSLTAVPCAASLAPSWLSVARRMGRRTSMSSHPPGGLTFNVALPGYGRSPGGDSRLNNSNTMTHSSHLTGRDHGETPATPCQPRAYATSRTADTRPAPGHAGHLEHSPHDRPPGRRRHVGHRIEHVGESDEARRASVVPLEAGGRRARADPFSEPCGPVPTDRSDRAYNWGDSAIAPDAVGQMTAQEPSDTVLP